MADLFPGHICVGGDVRLELVDELLEVIGDLDASLDWGDDNFEPRSGDDLLAALEADSGVLQLFDNQARYGQFTELEEWLQAHDVPYDRRSDAYGEYDAEAVSFRPDIGVVCSATTQHGDLLVGADHVRRARELLNGAMDERSPEKVRQALEVLDTALGPDVAPLPPLRLVANRQ